MRNFILASAVLAAAASFSRADDGETFTLPANWEPQTLNAPANGPAFIDPVFPAEPDEKGGEFAVTSEAPLYLEDAQPSVLDADEEAPRDGVASNSASDDWLDLPR